MKIANVALGNFNCKPDWSKLRDWMKRRRSDIVTVQKIGPGEPSVEEEFRKICYEGWFRYHKKNYLGVAILAHHDFLSRHDLSPPKVLDNELPGDDQYESRFPNESRFLTVSIGNLWISSVYAPYGPASLGEQGAIERRVAWLNRLRAHVCGEGHDRWMLCGDFNVKADGPPWGKFYSQGEKDALERLKNLGFCDLYRAKHKYGDSPEKRGHTRSYSKNYPHGTSRLHLMLASRSLTQRLQSACVDVESKPRPREDAPPLVVDLDDN